MEEKVLNIQIKDLKPFPNHPFKVRDDESMQETVESVKEYGVIVPIIVRESNDGYEIISGHRRKRACELAGIDEIPAIVRNLDDDADTTTAQAQAVATTTAHIRTHHSHGTAASGRNTATIAANIWTAATNIQSALDGTAAIGKRTAVTAEKSLIMATNTAHIPTDHGSTTAALVIAESTHVTTAAKEATNTIITARPQVTHS